MEIKNYVAQEKARIKTLVDTLSIKPKMVIVQVNDDPASDSYIKGKLKDSAEVGVDAELIKLPVDTTQATLISLVNKLNDDPKVHGLIVQMPLPKHIDEEAIKVAIAPNKDIDGFHPLSTMKACTPKGIIDYLTDEGVDFVGKNAVVIGRSNIVGKPLAQLLLAKHCNVTILHSRTTKADMEYYLAHADIVCVAIGKKWFIDEQVLKPDAILVDVGINRVDGVLYGDIKPNRNVKLQTPVPGGVGLLTRLSLIKNLLEAYERAVSH